MKKLLTILVCGLMAMSLVACSSNPAPAPTTTPESTENTGSETPTGTTQMGVGQSTTVKGQSVDADHEEGSAQMDTTYALLVLDAEGKIVTVKFDVAQNKSTWDAAGVATEGLQGTKLERGDDYAMRPASPIGKEWYEQIAAFEEFCVGKTVDEVLNLALDTENHNGPVDLATSCTMDVTAFQEALADASNHLRAVEGATTYELASVTSVKTQSVDADHEEGSVQYDTTYAGVAFDAEGKIVLVDIDVAQNKATFDATGTVLTAEPKESKQDLKDDYAMRPASPIGKEWFEQAEAFEEYCVGKTVAEVLGIALDTENHNGPVDLATSCTMDVTSFQQAIEKTAK